MVSASSLNKICAILTYHTGDQIMKNEMGGEGGVYGGEKTYIQGSGRET